MKKLILILVVIIAFTSCKKEAKEANKKSVSTDVSVNYSTAGIDTSSIPKGLNVGDAAPDITLITAENKKIVLSEYYKEQAVVILFYRGFWCPACNKHLSEFAEKSKQIEATGVKLIAITSESYENVTKTKEQTGANFTIISDSDGSIRKAFDVNFKVTEDYQAIIQDKYQVSIANTNANKQAELPVPATFILDKSGKIVYKHFNPDYKIRASVDDILNNLPK